MMSHASATSMARYFDHARGRAISIGSLGHAGGEAVFPIMAVLLAGAVGWRESWAVIGGVLALGLIPLLLWLLKGHGRRHAEFLRRMAAPGEAIAQGRQWSRREVLRDRFFHLLLPMFMAPSFVITGIFFNQVPLVETKGWTLSLFAGGFTVYAGATVAAALLAGGLVDRLGATRLSPFILLPLALGLLLLGIFDAPITVFPFMASAGISTGLFNTVTGALFAEVYGVRHLGAIRAMTTSLMVFSTALSPVAMGWFLEAGVGMEAISLACFVGVLLASALVPLALAGRRDKAFPVPGARGH
jgi:MFS family permease